MPKQRLTAIHLFQVNVSLFLSQGQQSTARTFKCHTCELRAAAQMTSLCSYSSFLLGVEHSNTLRDSVPTLCRVPFRFLTRATGTKILFNTLFIALNLSLFFFFLVASHSQAETHLQIGQHGVLVCFSLGLGL